MSPGAGRSTDSAVPTLSSRLSRLTVSKAESGSASPGFYNHDAFEMFEPLGNRHDIRAELGGRHQHHTAAVVEGMNERIAPQERAERHFHRPQQGRTQPDVLTVQAILHQGRNHVAGADAQFTERVGPSAGQLAGLGEGRLVAIDLLHPEPVRRFLPPVEQGMNVSGLRIDHCNSPGPHPFMNKPPGPPKYQGACRRGSGRGNTNPHPSPNCCRGGRCMRASATTLARCLHVLVT